MARIRIKLNKPEVSKQLLKSSEIVGMCESLAWQVAESAGPGYKARPVNYPERSGAVVYPDSAMARQDNKRNNTLLKTTGRMAKK